MQSTENLQKVYHYQVDATGLACPLPLLKMKQALNNAQIDEIIWVIATDTGSQRDFQSYVKTTNHQLDYTQEGNQFHYWITKKA